MITAIGPVHLERFGSEERILEAKSEILPTASTVVLNVDDARLADLAARLLSEGDGGRSWRARERRRAGRCLRAYTTGTPCPSSSGAT